jgi:multiple sugar transport system substrate-binding protein
VVKETVKETVVVEGTPQVVEKEVTRVVEKEIQVTVEPTAVPQQKVIVRFAPWPGAPSREPQKAVVQAFNETYEWIEVQEEEMGGEGNHYQKLKVRAAAGVLPDCAFMQGSHDYVSFITAQLLLPIDDLIAADPTFVREERIAPVAEPIFKVLGRTWGLPNEAAAFGMYYNKTMFDEAGVDYPTPDWTWQDFLEKAIALTKGEGTTKQYGYIQSFDPFRTLVWVRTNGGRYFSSDEFPRTISTTAPEIVEAIQFCQDLVYKYQVSPVEGQGAAEAGGISFDTGRIAMNMEGNWRAPGWAPKLKDLGMEWDVAPLPKKATQTTWLSVDITPIFATTEHPQECYEFIKFWNREGQPYMLELWGRMPVIPTDEGKASFRVWMEDKGAKPLATDAFWSAWSNGWILPLSPAWPEINGEVLTPAWEEIFQVAGTSVEAKLQEVEPEAQAILDAKGQPS